MKKLNENNNHSKKYQYVLGIDPYLENEELERVRDIKSLFRKEIGELLRQKNKYSIEDDQYSWGIADDEEQIWRKALGYIEKIFGE